MKRIRHQGIVLGLTVCLLASIGTQSAFASEEGHRNTAMGLGVVSAALLLTQKNKTAGIVAGVGAVYAESEHQRATRNRHRDETDWGSSDNRDSRDYREERDYRGDRDERRQERIRESEYRRAREERVRREQERREALRRERDRRERELREEARRRDREEFDRRDRRRDGGEDQGDRGDRYDQR